MKKFLQFICLLATVKFSLQCKDNNSFRFNGWEQRSCSWVAERNTVNRCNLVDSRGLKVKNQCKLTCNKCGGVRNTGHRCSRGTQCKSRICRKRTCHASRTCASLSTDQQLPPFHKDTIVLVIVGSGFEDKGDWINVAKSKYEDLKSFSPFLKDPAAKIEPFFVKNPTKKSFCHFNCKGIPRLLCCDENKAKRLSSKCFPSGSLTQTIVIENSDEYGGAGYRDLNIATISRQDSTAALALHELGHSLFELGDEYSYAPDSTADNSPNCSTYNSAEGACDKWSDLNDYDGVCVPGGCTDGKSYFGGVSFMRDIFEPIGLVNLRFTCCTFLALTNSAPNYCEFYNFGEMDNLMRYCQNDYQGYGGSSAYLPPPSGGDRDLESSSFNGASWNDGVLEDRSLTKPGNYLLVQDPIVVNFNLKTGKFNSKVLATSLYPSRQVKGDYDYTQNRQMNVDEQSKIVKVTVEFQSGGIQNFLFSTETSLDIPPLPFHDSDKESYEVTSIPSSEKIYSSHITMVVNSKNGKVRSVYSSHTI